MRRLRARAGVWGKRKARAVAGLRSFGGGPGYAGRTFTAFGPLSPASASYSTFAPSARERKPSPAIPVWWTKRSLPPSSGVTKPKPFSSLKHFTVAVALFPPRLVGCEDGSLFTL